ncbi:ABC transporter substrate-binding protein [Anaerococcus sp. AGMB00486]|uniref:ABC transporter substrate-binding protein n=3 Tax=Anaerococcus TaxID=165779 RepID=A0ABX2N7U7_9FIRM|nr:MULTISPECIES: ABC transporter substrate-binding protein [Anaerococcus]MSS77125.1 ABC transporter substrate-binding protein [Anaerococcus porci]NVF10764.1 ABC transporter substrate-binding protein [Anaerococcus faecalis]
MELKKSKLLGLTLSALMLFAGCAKTVDKPADNASSTEGGSSSNVSTTEKVGTADPNKDILKIVVGYDASSLDPSAQNEVAASNIMMQIFDGLVVMENDGTISPGLAESWDVEGNQKYTFHLRKGVKFQNGEPLTADDVVFTLDRAAKAPAVKEYYDGIDLDTLKAVDENTVEFSLKEPNSVFLAYLTHPGSYIMNKKAVEEAGKEVGSKPCGTGPYELVSWTKNDKVELKAFDDYWGKKPAIPNVEYRTVTEITNRAIEVETGNADIAYDIGVLDLDKLKDNPDINVIRKKQNSITYLGFNGKKAPFDNVNVRKAIAHTLDIPSIVNSVYKGLGEPSIAMVPSDIKYSKQKELKFYDVDIDEAKKLLEEAGVGDGFETTIITNENPLRVDMGTIIQSELEKVGIKAKVETLEWSTFLEKLKDPTAYDMYMLGWATNIADADVMLYALLNSGASAEGSNYSHFENEEFDKLLQEGRLTEDDSKRSEVYGKAQDILYDQLPILPLVTTEQAFAVRSYVKGFEPTSYAYHRIAPVSFNK